MLPQQCFGLMITMKEGEKYVPECEKEYRKCFSVCGSMSVLISFCILSRFTAFVLHAKMMLKCIGESRHGNKNQQVNYIQMSEVACR